ncbi:MAG: membrane protein insertase YidC, partial [Candidatus Acidiferrales bacterium]
MSDEQRAGLALVLMVLVLMVWSHFYKPATPQKPPETNPPAANVQSQQPQQAASVAASPTKKIKATRAAETGQPAAPTKEAASEETITVESSLYRVELSNHGGVVHSWKLEKYRNNENPPKPLELVNPAAAQQLNAWPLSIRLDDPKLDAAANNGLYVVT